MVFKRKIALTLVLLLLISALGACGGGSGGGDANAGAAGSGETTVWKLTHNAQPGQAIDLGTIKFAELVEEKTEGRLKIELFPNNILGPDHSTREMVVEGTVQMVAMGGGFLTPYNGAIDLTAMLYDFDSRDEMMYVVNGDWGKKWLEEPFLANQGLRILDHWPQSDRILISKKPVRTKADLTGLKIRVPSGMPLWEAAWTELGAMSLSLALEDAFTGMQQGVVDAVEMPLDFIYNYRFMEEAKYLTMTNHQLYTQFMIVNEAAFQALSPEDQQAVTDAMKEAGDYATGIIDENNDKMLKEMVDNYDVEVIELTDEQRAEFQAAIEPLYERFMENWTQPAYDDYVKAREEFKSQNQ